MKIIRVFPRKTKMTPVDDYAFIGGPPMMRPEANEVRVSCTFTWDIAEAQRLVSAWSQYYSIVSLGGPAISRADGFVPGVYVRPGVTFTSTGCNNQCPWCLAWAREGKLREGNFWAGNIIQDNNLLQCTRAHINRVFDMLRGQRQIELSGGLESRRVTLAIADQIRSLRVKQLFLACDTKEGLKPLRKAIDRLGMPPDKVRCYVLLKFDPNETISNATERLEDVWNSGCIPFAQLYQPPDEYIEYPVEWKRLARSWSRPAAMKAFNTRESTVKEAGNESCSLRYRRIGQGEGLFLPLLSSDSE